ncbi:MAG TPA: DNA polymerase III subunit delta' [Rhizomicrobium sp.]|jgi:DNA polymerase-3 subunit delta'|nr:DNA polymerase III subunit delta' [Rhizomicrobium sp.]
MPPRARSPKVEDVPETDRIEGFPHPREVFRLAGQDAALARAARAIRNGRPPPAWLITGPPGVGKATLAYRIARAVLAHGANANVPEDLAVPERDPAALQIAAASHPGLLILKRGLNDSGKLMSDLSVNVVRKLQGFFGMTSGAGGWRIAIIDTADDMNDAAANALLKMLEEPPPRAMLLLLSNVPGRLLPTIRSRCQRLALRPLDDATLESELARLLPDSDASERASLARLAGGSIGMALQLSGGDSVALAQEADRLLNHSSNHGGPPDVAAILALGDKIYRITDGLQTFGMFLAEALTARIRARALAGGSHLDRWVECLNRIESRFGRTGALNLEPRQTLLATAGLLADTSRRAGALSG